MKALVKRMLYHSGLLGLAGLARRRTGALVLRYHAVTESDAEVLYATPEICMPLAAFRRQMAFVRRAYTVLPLDELVERIGRGASLPPRALAVTFDDGYADNYRLAFPVLRDLGLTATVFVATGGLDGGPPLWMSAVRAVVGAGRREAARALTRELVPLGAAERAQRIAAAAVSAGVDPGRALAGTMLTWAQVRELAAAGWTIGAHTMSHPNVALAAPAEAEAEIAGSRDAIAAAIGAPVTHFAYPNAGGAHRYFDERTAALLRRLGFRAALTSRPGLLRTGSDPYALPRIGVGPRLAPVSELAAALARQRLAA
jgi:peptidoglycan/xylan/chitin deacetylase (PgdA/CDA1 family)